MKEIKDGDPSVLVLIVRANGEEEVAVEAFRSDARNYLKKPFRKDFPQGAGMPVLPGKASSTVTLGQYHKIQQAVRFINDNYRTDIRLDAVAAEAGMSPSHFSRIFRKVMGLPYKSFLNGCRITKAKNLLRTSPRSIAEVAISLGFADATGFGRIFKKLTGQTPSAFRSLVRK
jgi:two-component system response regulator YesN